MPWTNVDKCERCGARLDVVDYMELGADTTCCRTCDQAQRSVGEA